MQAQIERVIEEVTQEKFEKIAEAKGDYEFFIKRLEKKNEKPELKKEKQELKK